VTENVDVDTNSVYAGAYNLLGVVSDYGCDLSAGRLHGFVLPARLRE